MSILRIENASVVFGGCPPDALRLADEGLDRAVIEAATGQILAVHDATLDVGESEIVVLMGLSGSGKSSLLRTVNGLNPLARGDVQVRSGGRMVSVAQADRRTLLSLRRREISMVFQQFALLPWRSVADNIALGLELSNLPRKARQQRVKDQLAAMGLSGWADRAVAELSGGMQQRVGLARAFATQAPILLMDEPFSALDPLIRTRLQDDLLAMQKTARRTILFVSHDLDEAFRLGDRIALMEGGRIVQIGQPREILAAPATPYVADFVANLNPLAVLTAADLAEPGQAAGTPIAATTPLRQLMSALAETEALPVEGDGVITRAAVFRRLARGFPPGPARRGRGGSRAR